jgi:phytoene dehydrogenase-like protein
VLEARERTGGAADTSLPFRELPDVKVTTLSYVMSLMPPSIVRDLRLESNGYRVFPMGELYAPQPDEGAIHMVEDREELRERLARFSKRDADAYGDWGEWIQRSADLLGPVLMETPPPIGSTAPGDLVEQLRFALKFRRGLDRRRIADLTKLFTMSAADLLSEWFESDEVKAALSTDGIIGTRSSRHVRPDIWAALRSSSAISSEPGTSSKPDSGSPVNWTTRGGSRRGWSGSPPFARRPAMPRRRLGSREPPRPCGTPSRFSRWHTTGP